MRIRRSRSTMKTNPIYGRNRKTKEKTELDSTQPRLDSGTYAYAYDHVTLKSLEESKSPESQPQNNYDSLLTGEQREVLSSNSDLQYNRLFQGETMTRSESREPYCTLDSCSRDK